MAFIEAMKTDFFRRRGTLSCRFEWVVTTIEMKNKFKQKILLQTQIILHY